MSECDWVDNSVILSLYKPENKAKAITVGEKNRVTTLCCECQRKSAEILLAVVKARGQIQAD